jgi:hypothetical protein
MTKAIITSPFNKISGKPSSHRGAQAFIYASQLREMGRDVTVDVTGKVDFSQYDEIYVYHGNDWGGTLNMFGGVAKWDGVDRLANFSKVPPHKVYSLAIPFPKYSEMLVERMTKSGPQPRWSVVDLANLINIEIQAIRVDPNLGTGSHLMLSGERARRIVAGDSHAICMYRPGWMVNSVPYSTLHGSLVKGLHSFVSYDPTLVRLTDIELYFGNIDIRHHLCRQPNPDHAAILLGSRYVDEASKLANHFAATVKIYEPLPIEDESRKVPTTGFYKGTPFYGSWKERVRARAVLIKSIEDSIRLGAPVELIRWTDHLLNDEGQLSFEYMEKPRSIHLSRQFYPYWQGLDINTSASAGAILNMEEE